MRSLFAEYWRATRLAFKYEANPSLAVVWYFALIPFIMAAFILIALWKVLTDPGERLPSFLFALGASIFGIANGAYTVVRVRRSGLFEEVRDEERPLMFYVVFYGALVVLILVLLLALGPLFDDT